MNYRIVLILLSVTVALAILVILFSGNDHDQRSLSSPSDIGEPSHDVAEISSPQQQADDGSQAGPDELADLISPGSISEIDPSSVPHVEFPSDPSTRIPELIAEAENGSADAAEELYLLTSHCSPATQVPKTEEELNKRIQSILNTRSGPGDTVIEDQEKAVHEIRRMYELCLYMDQNAIPDHTEWIRTAAELGNHMAMSRFYSAHYSALVQNGELDSMSPDDMAELKADARNFVERARDEGSVEAFLTIGLSMTRRINGPYDDDPMRGYAHLQAAALAQQALILQRETSGYYAQQSGASKRDYDTARLGAMKQYARKAEHVMPAYELENARELVSELLYRCCH